MDQAKIKSIALYLPQFHPIPENDTWWGKGFTEWTNVTKARPLFNGHWQPRLPSDLGFYDLRVPEVREAQAQLAKEYGIHGFCYWHYWFAGKRILERPFRDVVNTGKPDFPFCIAWANQTWEGTWHGLSNNEILIKQTYPGKEDHISHFYSLLHAFRDERYINIKGRKLFFVFKPDELVDDKQFIDLWQELAIKEGLNGFHFVGMHMPFEWQNTEHGYDAMTAGIIDIHKYRIPRPLPNLKQRIRNKLVPRTPDKLPEILSYKKYVDDFPGKSLKSNQYPWVMPDWDNTPRSSTDGWLFRDSSPELFAHLCSKAFHETENKTDDEKIVLLKSWNEWAEGNYLEPDNQFGTSYLEHFKKALDLYTAVKKS